MPRQYRIQNIQTLLILGFTDEELRNFCFSERIFRPVYDGLAQNTGKATIIDRLIEYAEHQLQLETLLRWARERNPTRYQEHRPYYDEDDDHNDDYYASIVVVLSSTPRSLVLMGRGDECWLKLSKGDPVELIFNERVQITYGTKTGGNDRFYFIAEKGDRLLDVTGATIRPMLHIRVKFGSEDALERYGLKYRSEVADEEQRALDNLKIYEIAYHSGRVEGGWETCLRDHNKGDEPLNACDE